MSWIGIPSEALAGMDEQGDQGKEGKRARDEHDVEHRFSPVVISGDGTLRRPGIKVPSGSP
jgi:hypothetical protein